MQGQDIWEGGPPHQRFTSQPLRIRSGHEHQEPGENAPNDPPPAWDGACFPQLFLHWGRVPTCFCARGGHPRVQLQAVRVSAFGALHRAVSSPSRVSPRSQATAAAMTWGP